MSDNSPLAHRIVQGAVIALLLCALVTISGCGEDTDPGIELTGSFVEDTVVLSMPHLPETSLEADIGTSPSVDTTRGPEADAARTALPASAQRTSDGPATTPSSGWHRMAEVYVSVGDEVVAGEVLAVIDYAQGDAVVAGAEADLARASAELALIEEMSGDLTQGRSDIASQTIQLQNTVTDLRTQRAELQAQLDAARVQLQPPSTGTTPTPPPPGLVEQIAQLEGALADIETGIQQAEQGLVELEEAGAELEETQGVLGSVRATAGAVVEAREAVVELVKAQVERAIIVAPTDGVVRQAVATGEVRATGAPLVELQTLERPRVRTFLNAEEVRRVRDGSSARVRLDSMPDSEYTGLVIAIGRAYDYVPTTFATPSIHMTRGFEVIIEVYGAPDLPAGTPADVVIQTN